MERYRAQKAATTPPVLPLSVQMRVAAEMAAPEIRGLAEMIGTEWQAEALRLEGAVADHRADVDHYRDAIGTALDLIAQGEPGQARDALSRALGGP